MTMKDVYRLFTSKVAAGRKLDMETIGKLAEGRVFTGRMAKELGLDDRLGALDDAIERVLLPEPRGLFDDLFGMADNAGANAVTCHVEEKGGLATERFCLQGFFFRGDSFHGD